MIEARTGNKAICKSCHKPIEHGDVRIVETPATDHYPEHYHIPCYERDNLYQLIEVLDLLTGDKTEEDILMKEWEASQREEIVE